MALILPVFRPVRPEFRSISTQLCGVHPVIFAVLTFLQGSHSFYRKPITMKGRGVNLFEAITTRRTIKEFTDQPVPDDLLMQALDAGRWAQNHRMTEPWRFLILGPQSHRAIAAINGDAVLEKARADAPTLAKMRADAEAKLLSKPRIVAVTCALCGNKEVEQEDYAAVSCAVQNIQLAAWGLGLGMQWSTSGFTTRPETYTLLGADPDKEMIAGLLYFGYPASVPSAKPRKPLAEVSRILP